MEDKEILEKFERLTPKRRADILRKYQEEIASKEELSLQTLIDHLALNCVLGDSYPFGVPVLLKYYYSVFFPDNRFDIGHELESDYGKAYLFSQASDFIETKKIEGDFKPDKILSPLYSCHSRESYCWRNGYTYNPNKPDEIAVVFPLSEIMVPSMITRYHYPVISKETLFSIYEQTGAFLKANPSFYQVVISPMAKKLKRN